MSKPEFVYVIYIEATPDKVWNALLDPEMTKDFWGRRRNRSDWNVGSHWQHESYDDANDVAVTGTVLESDPPRRLVLTWSSLGRCIRSRTNVAGRISDRGGFRLCPADCGSQRS